MQLTFDLLWAKATNNNYGYRKTTGGKVNLAFNHKLAKIVMNTSADEGVNVALAGMKVTINGMNTTSKFNFSTGTFAVGDSPEAITSRTITNGKSYDAIIIPGSYNKDVVTVDFKLASDDTFTWDVGTVSFAGGNEYTYNVKLTRTGVQVTGKILPWELGNNGLSDITAE